MIKVTIVSDGIVPGIIDKLTVLKATHDFEVVVYDRTYHDEKVKGNKILGKWGTKQTPLIVFSNDNKDYAVIYSEQDKDPSLAILKHHLNV